MKAFYIVLFLCAATCLIGAPLPLGPEIDQNGNVVILMPIMPLPQPLVGQVPQMEQPPLGLDIFIAPADARADFIYATAKITTADGKTRTCVATAAIDKTRAFSEVVMPTENHRVISVQGVTIVTGESFSLGVGAEHSQEGTCRIAD